MTVRALKSVDPIARSARAGDGLALTPGAELGRKGRMIVRLASGERETEAAQALRYRVFYEEMDARPDAKMRASRLDADAFDEICDHLLVVTPPGESGETAPITVEDGEVVGTYRLLRQEIAEQNWGFYTADEYDISQLLAAKGTEMKFLELGRSCVLEPYRTRPVIELLWQGIWNYLQAHSIDVMLGCASLEGTDPQALALPLSYLHHFRRAPEEWRVRALSDRYVDMNLLPKKDVDERDALRAVPPLIKGYVRAGAYVGDGAVIDPQFNTTDVLIVLPVAHINRRYVSHFSGVKVELVNGETV
jgi:putative hemolysin